jgi:hypothetical protein
MNTRNSAFLLSTVFALVLTALLAPAQAASAFNAFFDFNGYANMTAAEDIAAPGVHLGSPFNPMSWYAMDSVQYASMSGRVLQNTACDAALVIELDATYQDVSFRFGIPASAVGLMVDGWMGEPGPGVKVFSQNLPGADMGSAFGMREGIASASVAGFDHVVIYSPGACAAIDDLSLNGTPIRLGPTDLTLPTVATRPAPELPLLPIIQQPVGQRGN